MKKEYVIQISKELISSERGYFLESHCRTDIWKPDIKDAKVFTSLKEANLVSKKYRGEVIPKN